MKGLFCYSQSSSKITAGYIWKTKREMEISNGYENAEQCLPCRMRAYCIFYGVAYYTVRLLQRSCHVKLFLLKHYAIANTFL